MALMLTEVADLDLTDPATLRAALARSELLRYELAARVKRDPSTLSQMLNGHRPIPEELGARIFHACAKATRKPRTAATGPA
jgi:hypothetical protein